MAIKWLCVFMLVGVGLLTACTAVAPAVPNAEVAIPTPQIESLVAITRTVTAIQTIEEATVTPLPTKTASPIGLATEPLTPLLPPTMIRPPYSYPDPNATPAPTSTPRPTATPYYTADGEWRIVTNTAIRFEIPADWFVTPRRLTNYPPQEPDIPPATYAPRDEPFLTIEYTDIGNYKYDSDSYIQQGYEPITVAGYPALFHSEYSEPWGACYLGLIIETPGKAYTFFLNHSMSPDAEEDEIQAALARGEGILQHIAETFELFPLPASTIPIENQIEITGTVASVDTLGGQIIALEPSFQYPFTEVLIWYGSSTRTLFTTPNGDELVFGNVKVGDMVEVQGRPLSEHEFLGDTIKVTQQGIQGIYTEPVQYEGEVWEVQAEFSRIFVASRSYPNGFINAQLSEDTVLILQDSAGTFITYADIAPNAKITVIGYARPDSLNDVMAQQIIISP